MASSGTFSGRDALLFGGGGEGEVLSENDVPATPPPSKRRRYRERAVKTNLWRRTCWQLLHETELEESGLHQAAAQVGEQAKQFRDASSQATDEKMVTLDKVEQMRVKQSEKVALQTAQQTTRQLEDKYQIIEQTLNNEITELRKQFQEPADHLDRYFDNEAQLEQLREQHWASQVKVHRLEEEVRRNIEELEELEVA